jgi:hypothetical protein
VWVADNFFYPFQGFLITLGVPVAVWSAIFVADVILRKKAYIEKDLYDLQGMYQTMILGKKQWALNPGLASDPISLDPKSFDANFNDFVKNASSILQENSQKIKSDIYSK